MAVTPVKGREGFFDVVVRTHKADDAPARRITRRVQGLRNAQRVETQLKSQRDTGQPLVGPPTVSAYAATYLDSRRHAVSGKTMQTYRDMMRWYVEPVIGKRRLSAVTKTTVRSLYADLAERGLSANTVSGVHRVLSMIMRAAFEDDLIRRNPCSKAFDMKRMVAEKADERGLEPDQCRSLLADLDGTPVYAPSALAVLTGLRRGEALALRWEDIDLEGGELHVRSALEQAGATVTRQRPKTPRSRRTVPLTPAAIVLLRRHRAGQDVLRLRWGVFWRDEGYVFPSGRVTQSLPGGRVWTPQAFTQAFRKATRAKGHHIGFHEFRHTAATTWLRSGVRVEVVSRWLGHANSAITLSVYSHIVAEERRDGVEAVDSLLG